MDASNMISFVTMLAH